MYFEKTIVGISCTKRGGYTIILIKLKFNLVLLGYFGPLGHKLDGIRLAKILIPKIVF
jgi:hypothetical protein